MHHSYALLGVDEKQSSSVLSMSNVMCLLIMIFARRGTGVIHQSLTSILADLG